MAELIDPRLIAAGRFRDGWNRQDHAALAELCHPEIVWTMGGSGGPDAAPLHGLDAVATYWDSTADTGDWDIVVRRVWLTDRWLISDGLRIYTSRSTGLRFEEPAHQLLRFEDGLLREFAQFDSADEALAHAGLDAWPDPVWVNPSA